MDEVFVEVILGISLLILCISLVVQIMIIKSLKSHQKRSIDQATLDLTKRLQSPSKPDIKQQPEILPKKVPHAVIEHHRTIEESLMALCQLYRVNGITIASKDGLIVAASYDNAQEDAAKYSYIFNKGGKMDDPGINIFGLTYKLSTMVGIIKSSERIDDETIQSIKENVMKILNYWL